MAGSAFVVFGFGLLSVVCALGLIFAVAWSSRRLGLPAALVRRRVAWVALGGAGWLAVTFALAASGALAFGSLPPRVMIVIALAFAATIMFARSALGRDLARALPFSVLVGFQVYRIGVEILLHQASLEGLSPPQMTWSGFNFDVVTGIVALPVAWLAARGHASNTLIAIWNALGALLLLNVVVIAIVSMPTPLRLFWNEPANTWIAQAPFVWLPTVLVPAALLSHLLVWQRLRQSSQRSPLSTSVIAE